MKLLVRCLLLAVLVVSLAVCPPIRAAEPGSKDDPVVTRTYLENLYSWQVTNVQEGQTLGLDLGVTFVLRSGKATVVGVGSEGLVDLTAGRELKEGQPILPHHLILSPASDRRGVRALTPVVLLTRGLSR